MRYGWLARSALKIPAPSTTSPPETLPSKTSSWMTKTARPSLSSLRRPSLLRNEAYARVSQSKNTKPAAIADTMTKCMDPSSLRMIVNT